MVYALVDCNNFYVSCERAFNPRLEGVPVAVLSNNDGCVIARSQEVKDMGITMGTPAFQIREKVKSNGIRCLSSNYTLYGDMSGRVMDVLSHFAPSLEIYSIDEAFLDFTGINNRAVLGRHIRSVVRQWTGIPVGVGIAETKTLAKIANRLGKKNKAFNGVCDFGAIKGQERDSLLESVKIEDVWGVGFAHAPRLRANGITTARLLRDADRHWIRAHMGVCGLRTVLELSGIGCMPLERIPPARKGITSSRSFSQPVISENQLIEAAATYTDRAAAKLRRYGLATNAVTAFVQTNQFREKDPQYSNTATVTLTIPSNDTAELIACSSTCIHRIFRDGFRYKKAGVMFTDLVNASTAQTGLFDDTNRQQRKQLMETLDAVNARHGSGCLFFGAQGIQQRWKMQREHLSPSYTTNWDDLMTVHAK